MVFCYGSATWLVWTWHISFNHTGFIISKQYNFQDTGTTHLWSNLSLKYFTVFDAITNNFKFHFLPLLTEFPYTLHPVYSTVNLHLTFIMVHFHSYWTNNDTILLTKLHTLFGSHESSPSDFFLFLDHIQDVTSYLAFVCFVPFDLWISQIFLVFDDLDSFEEPGTVRMSLSLCFSHG